jgi:Rieske Fe-S protein
MSVPPFITRRTALAAGLAGAGAVTLAACGGGGSGSSAAEPTSSAADQKVAALDSVKVGNSAAAKIGNANVLVFRTGADSAVCFSAVCTHEGCQVQPDGTKFACHCHGSMFDAKTGKVLQGPATQPLAEVPVKVDNGQIVTAGGSLS